MYIRCRRVPLSLRGDGPMYPFSDVESASRSVTLDREPGLAEG